ncbi:hypothetical protein C8046_10850 [Serinibacter arcticus]|uniref:Uncharacterized protein n=1 Tax=Serinibacter arcticus TaxID=1655435 RepID=A0A2U1ZVV5_9MICO|nr:hypothetical protein [Serinibacter arcticus]PWD51070.1 hypothetical protein C8046_10850 [Serinibacter arcticus]
MDELLAGTDGDWRWRIHLERPAETELVLRMENVVPPSVAGGTAPLVYDAMRAVLHRAVTDR